MTLEAELCNFGAQTNDFLSEIGDGDKNVRFYIQNPDGTLIALNNDALVIDQSGNYVPTCDLKQRQSTALNNQQQIGVQNSYGPTNNFRSDIHCRKVVSQFVPIRPRVDHSSTFDHNNFHLQFIEGVNNKTQPLRLENEETTLILLEGDQPQLTESSGFHQSQHQQSLGFNQGNNNQHVNFSQNEQSARLHQYELPVRLQLANDVAELSQKDQQHVVAQQQVVAQQLPIESTNIQPSNDLPATMAIWHQSEERTIAAAAHQLLPNDFNTNFSPQVHSHPNSQSTINLQSGHHCSNQNAGKLKSKNENILFQPSQSTSVPSELSLNRSTTSLQLNEAPSINLPQNRQLQTNSQDGQKVNKFTLKHAAANILASYQSKLGKPVSVPNASNTLSGQCSRSRKREPISNRSSRYGLSYKPKVPLHNAKKTGSGIFECYECGAKFDKLLRLTEHDCYEDDDDSDDDGPITQYHFNHNSLHAGKFHNSGLLHNRQQAPGIHSDKSQSDLQRGLPPGLIRCPRCSNIFNFDYFEKQHKKKCFPTKSDDDKSRNYIREKTVSVRKPDRIDTLTGQRSQTKGRLKPQPPTLKVYSTTKASIDESSASHNCANCHRRYKNESSLKSHRRICTQNKCVLCSKTFKKYSRLFVHEERCYQSAKHTIFTTLHPAKVELVNTITAKIGRSRLKCPVVEIDENVERFLWRRWKNTVQNYHNV